MRRQDDRPERGLDGQPRQLVGHIEGLATPVAMTSEHRVGNGDEVLAVRSKDTFEGENTAGILPGFNSADTEQKIKAIEPKSKSRSTM